MDIGKNSQRPSYSEYAWAFDLVIDRPIENDCATIMAWLTERGVPPGSELLDAGCGTGRYAAELARNGYVVHGIDLSPEFIQEASRSLGRKSHSVSFAVGSILDLPAARYDAILCRGVLNDFVDDDDCEAAFAAFAQALRHAGILIVDVREWDETARLKSRNPVFEKTVTTDRGKLTFMSVTRLDAEHRRLLVSERHTLDDGSIERSSDYEFVMRCWTRGELESILRLRGFGGLECYGAYDAAILPGQTDRLMVVAQLADATV